jgi:hypothetical protein
MRDELRRLLFPTFLHRAAVLHTNIYIAQGTSFCRCDICIFLVRGKKDVCELQKYCQNPTKENLQGKD